MSGPVQRTTHATKTQQQNPHNKYIPNQTRQDKTELTDKNNATLGPLPKTLSQLAKAITANSPVDQPITNDRDVQNLYTGTGTIYMTYHFCL